jgi:hypothetical protein
MRHFPPIHDETGVPYSRMLFFDDKQRNVVGVPSYHFKKLCMRKWPPFLVYIIFLEFGAPTGLVATVLCHSNSPLRLRHSQELHFPRSRILLFEVE